MDRSLYIMASGMLTELARQDRIANDLANASTPGYKQTVATQHAFDQMAEGLGETVYYPASMSLIGAYHEPETRSRAMGLHQTSVYVGTIAGGFFAGLIDEVRVYNRALSATEIATDMSTPLP